MPSFLPLPLLVLLSLLGAPLGEAKKKRSKRESTDTRDPTHNALAMSHHQRGTMAHVQGDLKGAVRSFRDAIAVQPDFAYAYFRLGFVLNELHKQRPGQHTDDPVPVLQTALALDPKDEMVHYSLGQVLQERGRHTEAADVFETITSTINPRSAQAYWALGKVRAKGVDEWEGDPDDPLDPSHCYEQASRLRPDEFGADGSRTRRVEPMTPEREEREQREAQERRQRLLREMQDGTANLNYAMEHEPRKRRRKPPPPPAPDD